MNATEQRTHRTVTQSLESRIGALETVVAQHGINDEWLKAAIGEERTHRLKLANEQRSYVDGEDRKISQALNQHCGMSLLARLRWLFLGR